MASANVCMGTTTPSRWVLRFASLAGACSAAGAPRCRWHSTDGRSLAGCGPCPRPPVPVASAQWQCVPRRSALQLPRSRRVFLSARRCAWRLTQYAPTATNPAGPASLLQLEYLVSDRAPWHPCLRHFLVDDSNALGPCQRGPCMFGLLGNGHVAFVSSCALWPR